MPTPPIATEKRELVFCLLRQGVRVGQIEQKTGVSRRTVGRLLASLGVMPRPFEAEYDARYLTRDERYEIARLHDGGVSVRGIAARLARSPSTISRELRRNQHPRLGSYLPETAHGLAWQRQRRPKPSKLAGNPVLRGVVQQLLENRWSPEQVAGRLGVVFP